MRFGSLETTTGFASTFEKRAKTHGFCNVSEQAKKASQNGREKPKVCGEAEETRKTRENAWF